MRKRRKEEKKDSSNWLVTYSDLVTLLLSFFVLLFSFSEIDAQKFRSIMSSFQGGTGVLEGGTTLDEENDLEDKSGIDEDELEELRNIIEEYAESIGLADEISLDIEERGLVIRFMDSIFFDPGRAEIKPKSKEILHSVASILKKKEFQDKYIKIEGHTDTVPIIYSTEYPTNWELSAIRATNVLRYLVEEEKIEGERISSSGYSYYRPIVPNDTDANKAKNRRVDIVILRTSFEKWEP